MRACAHGAERPNQTRGKRPPDDWPSHGQNTLAAPKATATHSSRPGQIVARQWINASLPTPEAIHDNLTVRSTAGGALQVYTTHNAHAEPDRTRATDHAKTSSEDRQFHGAKSVGLRKKTHSGTPCSGLGPARPRLFRSPRGLQIGPRGPREAFQTVQESPETPKDHSKTPTMASRRPNQPSRRP